jgi:hypothetical protein
MRNIDWRAVEARYEDAVKVARPPKLAQKEFERIPGVSLEEVRRGRRSVGRCRCAAERRRRGRTFGLGPPIPTDTVQADIGGPSISIASFALPQAMPAGLERQ